MSQIQEESIKEVVVPAQLGNLHLKLHFCEIPEQKSIILYIYSSSYDKYYGHMQAPPDPSLLQVYVEGLVSSNKPAEILYS